MPTSLIKKGRVRTQVKSASLRERDPPISSTNEDTKENEETGILPPLLQQQQQQQLLFGKSATVLPPSKNQSMETKDWFLDEPIWTDIPIARSLTIQADEELWPETEEDSIQQSNQANRFQWTSQVFPDKDALFSVLVQGQRGQVIYDVGGSMDYTVRNGGVRWKTPGLESWMGAIPQRRSLAQSLKQRAILWQTGASWNFTEENALWNVSMVEPQSRVQWKVGSSWLTEVQDGAIQFVIPDAGHWWIRTQQTPHDPPLPHPQMGLHSRGTLSLKADRSAQIESRHLAVLLDTYQGFIKQRWRQQQGTLQYAIGDQETQRQYITKPGDQTNYHIDSWNGDWDWTLWNGQFAMNLYHRPEEKSGDEDDEERAMGWHWATPETNSYWTVQLGHQSWKWNQEGCIWDIRGDSSYLSQTGGFTWIGEKEGEEGFHWKNQAKRGGFRWTTGENGTSLFDIGRFMTVSLLQDNSRFEVFHGKRGIDWRVGATGQPNIDFLWLSRGSFCVDTRDQFKVKAEAGLEFTTKGARGILIQSQDPYADVVFETGVEGALVFKGHTFQMECEEWKWHGLSSFKGVQEKGWFWGATQGMIRGVSGDTTKKPTDCVSHEAGIEWKTVNAEQPVRLSTQGTQSLIELESERSGILLQSGGVEGIRFTLRNQYESQQPKGWIVDMRDAGAIDWRITEKDGLSYWRMVLDGCAEHLSFGKEGSGFQRGIILEQMAHEWDWVKGGYDWVEETRPLSLTGERLAIHSRNVCEREGSLIEWNWGEKNTMWKATVGQEILFQLNQPNAHFTVQALRENSQIHLQAENAVLLQSTQANAFIQAHQDIYLRAGRLIEQTIEEGSWKVRVARTPPTIQRALDIQVNGETYCASTKKQMSRCLDNENGQFIWTIGRDKQKEQPTQSGFHWVYEDGAHLTLDKDRFTFGYQGAEEGGSIFNIRRDEFRLGSNLKGKQDRLNIMAKETICVESPEIRLNARSYNEEKGAVGASMTIGINSLTTEIYSASKWEEKDDVESTVINTNVKHKEDWKDSEIIVQGDENSIKRESWEKYELEVRDTMKYKMNRMEHCVSKDYILSMGCESGPMFHMRRGFQQGSNDKSIDGIDETDFHEGRNVFGMKKIEDLNLRCGSNLLSVNGDRILLKIKGKNDDDRINRIRMNNNSLFVCFEERNTLIKNRVENSSVISNEFIKKSVHEDVWRDNVKKENYINNPFQEHPQCRDRNFISQRIYAEDNWEESFMRIIPYDLKATSDPDEYSKPYTKFRYYNRISKDQHHERYNGISHITVLNTVNDLTQSDYIPFSSLLITDDTKDKTYFQKSISYSSEHGLNETVVLDEFKFTTISDNSILFRHNTNKLYMEDYGISSTVLDTSRIVFQGAPGITFGIGNLQEIEKKQESFEKEVNEYTDKPPESPSVVWNLGEHSVWIAKGGSSVSWNPSQWSLHTSNNQEYLSLGDDKDAFVWEAFGTNGGMRWTVGENGQFLWEGGKEMIWRLDDESGGRMVWKGVKGGSWEWDGREEDMTMRSRMARRDTVIGWPRGCQEQERSHYREWVRCLNERGWNEARREIELGFQGGSIDRALWEEGVIAWQEYRGMKCEWIQDERRWVEGSTKTEFSRLDARVGYTWVDGSGLTFLRDGIEWSHKGTRAQQLRYNWDEKRPALEWDGLLKTHGLQFGRGSLVLHNNRITTENEETPIVLKSKTGILIDGPLRFLGVNEEEGHHKWDAGEGLYSSVGIDCLTVEYPRVSMKEVEVNSWKMGDEGRTAQLGADGRLELSDWEPARVRTFQEAHYENGKEENRSLLSVLREEKTARAVQVRGGVAVDGSVEVEEDLSVRGKIRRAPKKRSGLNREVPRERVKALMENLEVVEHDEEQVEGLLDGERVSETVDVWDMVLLLTAEVQQLRKQVALLSQKK